MEVVFQFSCFQVTDHVLKNTSKPSIFGAFNSKIDNVAFWISYPRGEMKHILLFIGDYRTHFHHNLHLKRLSITSLVHKILSWGLFCLALAIAGALG